MDIIVLPRDEWTWTVEVRESDTVTRHEVQIPRGYPRALGLSEVPAEFLVKTSFEFLLEREPPSSILRRFRLDEIGRYFPEYPAEIRKRCAEPPATPPTTEHAGPRPPERQRSRA